MKHTDNIRIRKARHGRGNPYFMMTRAVAQNKGMTWEARGLLAYLLSKPVDWQLRPSDLEQQCGKSKVYRILKELIKAGHIERVRLRDEETKQLGEVEYYVYEEPAQAAGQGVEEPYTDLPDMAEPDMAEPDMANRPLHNKELYRVENIQSREKKPDARASVGLPPTLEQYTDAIARVLGIHGKRAMHYYHFLRGTSKTGTYAEYALPPDEPVTPDELIAFGDWYKMRNPDLSVPLAPDKLESELQAHRAHCKKREARRHPQEQEYLETIARLDAEGKLEEEQPHPLAVKLAEMSRGAGSRS